MPKPFVHSRREKYQPGFPNNRLSNRRRRKRKAEKRKWAFEETDQYLAVPDNAIFTPFDHPNPADSAPSFSDSYTMNYSETGGYTPPGFSDEFSPDLVGMVPGLGNSNFDPSPIALMLDVGHGFTWQKIPTYRDYTETGGVQEFFLVSGLDYPSMYTGGYNVNVTIYDMAGNVAYMETEVDGLFSGLVDFLTMIWDGLCGVMEAAADAVGAAMSFLADIVLAILTDVLGPLFAPFTNALNNLLAGLIHEFEVAYELALPFLNAGQEIPDSVGVSLFNYFAVNIIPLLLGISLAMSITLMALNPIVVGVPIVIPLITLLVAGILIGILAPPDIEIQMPNSLPQGLSLDAMISWVAGTLSLSSGADSNDGEILFSVENDPIYVLGFATFIATGLAGLAGLPLLAESLIPGESGFFSWFFTMFGFFVAAGALVAIEYGNSEMAQTFGFVATVFSAISFIIDGVAVLTNFGPLKLSDMAGEIGLIITSLLCLNVGIYVFLSVQGG